MPVTEDNKYEYVEAYVHDKLIGCRQSQLKALREGFREVDLSKALQHFSAKDLMLVLCGVEDVDAELVIRQVFCSRYKCLVQCSFPRLFFLLCVFI